MKVIVCGGRDFHDTDAVRKYLDRFHAEHAIEVLIEGGALGADKIARNWALDKGLRCYTVWAPWPARSFSAGPVRNGWMLELKPDAVIAFPGHNGTANMVHQARAAKVRVYIVGVGE